MHTTPAYRPNRAAPGDRAGGGSSHHLLGATIALVLAGGRGTRLKQLSEHRAKPAICLLYTSRCV